MQYTDIIKRAWRITWRYKALWVLGIFAGVSGCQGGSSTRTSNTRTGSDPFTGGGPKFADYDRFLPVIIASVIALIVIGIIWWLLGLAARGGLVWSVDRIEQGTSPRLGEAWRAGFGTFGKVLGLWLLLRLPLAIFGIGLAALAVGPFVGALIAGRDPDPGFLAPLCGVFGIGIPILLVASLLLGILDLVALRYLVIGGRGVVDSIRAAWGAMMARKKDHFLMWVVNWLLNLAASFVIAIPIVIVAIAVFIPAAMRAEGGDWTTFIGAIAIAAIVAILLGILYSGIWGLFTSALWTIFFRKLTGMEPAVAMPAPAGSPGYPPAPPVGYAPQPPDAPGSYTPQPPAPTFGDQTPPPAPPVGDPQPPAPPVGE